MARVVFLVVPLVVLGCLLMEVQVEVGRLQLLLQHQQQLQQQHRLSLVQHRLLQQEKAKVTMSGARLVVVWQEVPGASMVVALGP